MVRPLSSFRSPALTHIQVLHEASGFVVVAKPAGVMVHRNKFSRKDEAGEALLQRVRDQLGRHGLRWLPAQEGYGEVELAQLILVHAVGR